MNVSSLHLPAGWFAAALAFDTAGIRAPVAWDAEPIAPAEAFRRFLELQSRERPLLRHGDATYSVVDLETVNTDEGRKFLYYARHASGGGRAESPWAVFLQDGALDAEPVLIPPRSLQNLFLVDYTDKDLHARPGEIRRAKVIGRGPIETLRRSGRKDLLRQRITLQNGHPITFVWHRGETDWTARTPEGRREVWQVSPDLLEKVVLEVPLPVLTQVDEIWIRRKYHPVHGQSFVRGGRRLVNLYPNDVRETTALFHRIAVHPELKDVSPWKARLHSLRYTVFHEIFGHPLVHDRFLRREIIKIMAAGERPPTVYALTSPDEWIAEGTAERWIRVAYRSSDLAAWDENHRYLSGLILNLLAVLQGKADPASENVRRWSLGVRRSRLLSPA